METVIDFIIERFNFINNEITRGIIQIIIIIVFVV